MATAMSGRAYRLLSLSIVPDRPSLASPGGGPAGASTGAYQAKGALLESCAPGRDSEHSQAPAAPEAVRVGPVELANAAGARIPARRPDRAAPAALALI